MARKSRFEFPGAGYHVINRGNYRRDLFGKPGTAGSFEKSPRCRLDAGDDQRQQRVAGGKTEDGTTRDGQPMRQAFPAGKRGTDGRLRAGFVNGQLVTLSAYSARPALPRWRCVRVERDPEQIPRRDYHAVN